MLLLTKNHTGTLIRQTKSKPQETLEFKMNKQMQTFSFNPPIDLSEVGKRLLAVTFFEVKNSVFNITDENNSFSTTIPGHWDSKSAEKTIDELNKLLKLRTQNGIDLNVEQVKKGLILLNDYSLSSLGTFKEEILEELKKAKYDDVEDLVYRFQLTHDEIIDILDLKYIPNFYHTGKGLYNISPIGISFKTLYFVLSYFISTVFILYIRRRGL